jgi:hypothetical protein
VEVPGEYVSSTMVKCVSPSFMDIGSGEVEVRVSLNGDSYTTTYQKYSFFAVTNAEKCICFGPGIISGGAPQVETVFVIQAVDATGTFRVTGGYVNVFWIQPSLLIVLLIIVKIIFYLFISSY